MASDLTKNESPDTAADEAGFAKIQEEAESALLIWSWTLRMRNSAEEAYTAVVGIDLSLSPAIGGMKKSAPILSAIECAGAMLSAKGCVDPIAMAVVDEINLLGAGPVGAAAAGNLGETLSHAWRSIQEAGRSGWLRQESAGSQRVWGAHAEARELAGHWGSFSSSCPVATAVAERLAQEMNRMAKNLFGEAAVLFAQAAGAPEEFIARMQAAGERRALARVAGVRRLEENADVEAGRNHSPGKKPRVL